MNSFWSNYNNSPKNHAQNIAYQTSSKKFRQIFLFSFINLKSKWKSLFCFITKQKDNVCATLSNKLTFVTRSVKINELFEDLRLKIMIAHHKWKSHKQISMCQLQSVIKSF